jgi:uncharacterized protein
MADVDISKQDLFVKKSTLRDSGKGLFTRRDIPKGALIAEYKGKITNWKEAKHVNNAYIYYVTRNHVIDAKTHVQSLARFANDARGLTRQKGVTNNAEYVEKGKKVFIRATKKIPAGSEILVGYGKEYWDAIRYNRKLDKA